MNPTAPIKLVILDRDGTINIDREDYVKAADEWEALPGALEGIARLNHEGWHVVIATNQSGLGRGLFDMGTLNAMHIKMNQALAKVGGRIDAVFFCPHAPHEECDCRKPLPGLFEQIAERYGIDLTGRPAIGDSLRDLQAAAAVGCETHLVRTGKCAALDAADIDAVLARVPGTHLHADLAAAAEFIVQRERQARALARGTALAPVSGPGALS